MIISFLISFMITTFIASLISNTFLILLVISISRMSINSTLSFFIAWFPQIDRWNNGYSSGLFNRGSKCFCKFLIFLLIKETYSQGGIDLNEFLLIHLNFPLIEHQIASNIALKIGRKHPIITSPHIIITANNHILIPSNINMRTNNHIVKLIKRTTHFV